MSFYVELYRLGGLTSFVPFRSHYVGYIAEKGLFLFYDGLAPEYPVLRKYNRVSIEGDISLLCYLPLDSIVDCTTMTDEHKNSDENRTNQSFSHVKKVSQN